MSRRVAVTGARGFIGQHVMLALTDRGDTAVAVRRPFEPAALADRFRGVDAVVHLAGVVSAVHEDDFRSGNVESTRIVATAARDAGAHLVHVSSLAAAGPAPSSRPRSEDDPCSPITIYGRTKLQGEQIVESLPALGWTTLRPGVVYGPGDRAMVPLFRYARLGVLPIIGNPAAAYTFIYVDDAVRAILAALDREPLGRAVFLGHATPVTPHELMTQVQAAARSSSLLLRVPRPVIRLAAWAGDAAGAITGAPAAINSRRFLELYSPGFVCRVDRMRDLLGIVASVGLEEGMRRAGSWYQTQAKG
jgi:nucleoside-diphosphate-sugar epimerase